MNENEGKASQGLFTRQQVLKVLQEIQAYRNDKPRRTGVVLAVLFVFKDFAGKVSEEKELKRLGIGTHI